jgi:F0F1-type ATP synthase assembly protein I
MKLSPYTVIQSKDEFNKSRDADGFVKGYIQFNESYINDIKYALKNLNVIAGNPVGNMMPISFPYDSFNKLKQIVGITYLEVQEPISILPIQNTSENTGDKLVVKESKNKIKMKKYINIKTIAGVGVGVAIGHFALKSKNPLILIALGIGGGILANMYKTKAEKEEAELEAKAQRLLAEVSNDLDVNDEELQSDVEGIRFNPTVGYFTPYGSVDETNPSDYMDVRF